MTAPPRAGDEDGVLLAFRRGDAVHHMEGET